MRAFVISLGFIALLAIAASGPSRAFEPNCDNPTSQVEMTFCAGKDYEAADTELNRIYARVRAEAKNFDASAGPYNNQSAADLLLEAQRAWITFRDKACDYETSLWQGGTGASMASLLCLARLTRERTKDLRDTLGHGG